MKRISKVFVVSGLVHGLAGAASFAEGNIVTRSVDDANADLMRTYKTHGGQPAGMVRARSAEGAHADLIRDWNAKFSLTEGSVVQTRKADDAYSDLMRLTLGFGPTAN